MKHTICLYLANGNVIININIKHKLYVVIVSSTFLCLAVSCFVEAIVCGHAIIGRLVFIIFDQQLRILTFGKYVTTTLIAILIIFDVIK
eukprot:m.273878 g.273878  ORF g.273878 m.273878 type:complete len:89 (+) comp16282_c7_seq36:27-293(+)